MEERANGTWAGARVADLVARQNGKGGLLEAREVFGLTVLNEWVIHTAHLFKTTRDAYNRLLELVNAHPDVRGLLTYNVASPASGYEMRFEGGGRITFIARSKTSGRGLTGDVLICDEAQDLSDDELAALLPTISARPGAQAWFTGSAPNLDSSVWHRIRKLGRSGGDGRLAYLEYSADPKADLDDRAAWAQANPALGSRITEEAIESERASMDDEMFARERLSISPDVIEHSVFPGTSWQDVCDPDAAASAGVFALDANPERSAAGIVVGGPGPVLEVIDYRPGVSWLLDRAPELADRYNRPFVLDPKGPAGSLVDDLQRSGVELIIDIDLPSACESFYDAVVEGKVTIREHGRLDAAAIGAEKRSSGDRWVWGRKPSQVDISLLVAATLAYAATEREPEREPEIW